jgi:hypothetical protein
LNGLRLFVAKDPGDPHPGNGVSHVEHGHWILGQFPFQFPGNEAALPDDDGSFHTGRDHAAHQPDKKPFGPTGSPASDDMDRFRRYQEFAPAEGISLRDQKVSGFIIGKRSPVGKQQAAESYKLSAGSQDQDQKH